MDNTTAEYAFVTTFFTPDRSALRGSKEANNSIFSPVFPLANRGSILERQSQLGSEFGGQALVSPRGDSIVNANITAAKEDQSNLDTIWKQIMDPVLEYTQVRHPVVQRWPAQKLMSTRPLCDLF